MGGMNFFVIKLESPHFLVVYNRFFLIHRAKLVEGLN